MLAISADRWSLFDCLQVTKEEGERLEEVSTAGLLATHLGFLLTLLVFLVIMLVFLVIMLATANLARPFFYGQLCSSPSGHYWLPRLVVIMVHHRW